MEQSEIIKPPVPCPVCGAESQYRIWSQVTGYAGGFALRSPKRIFFSNSQVDPLVCTVCGYVQFFVNPEDFRD